MGTDVLPRRPRPALIEQPSLFGFDPPGFDPGFATLERRYLGFGAWVDHAPGWVRGHEALFAAVVDAVERWQGVYLRHLDRRLGIEEALDRRLDLLADDAGQHARRAGAGRHDYPRDDGDGHSQGLACHGAGRQDRRQAEDDQNRTTLGANSE